MRVPEPRKRKSGKSTAIFVLVAAGVALAMNVKYPSPRSTSQSAGSAIDAYCRDSASEANGAYQSWKDVGVIKDSRKRVVIVDELPWEAMTHKQKVSLTIYAYCNFGSNYVSVEGYHDGQQKAHMVDGNYFD